MTTCILCEEGAVTPFFDLGRTALANKFLLPEELSAAAEPTYPLVVGVCERCGHVQLVDRVPPPAMFDDYLYVSGASSTLTDHLGSLARVVTEWTSLTADDLVVDVGCNDGTLLAAFGRESRARRLGIDPAVNLEPLRAAKGIQSIVAFFSPDTARTVRAAHGPASVITLTNTFPHIPDLPGLMRAFDHLLAPNGTVVIEAHYLRDMVETVAFDTIYHEHVSYWALGPLRRLFQRHGFDVMHAERLPIHHGQLRVFIQRQGARKPSPAVERLLREEEAMGLTQLQTLRRFAAAARGIRTDLRKRLTELKSSGKTVAGYGAPAKASTLMAYLQLGPKDITYIADRSTLKQGRLTPGTHIPIVSPERLLQDQPDYVLLLAWNFADEIIAQLADYRARGGRFIIPVPQVVEI